MNDKPDSPQSSDKLLELAREAVAVRENLTADFVDLVDGIREDIGTVLTILDDEQIADAKAFLLKLSVSIDGFCAGKRRQ